LPTAPSENELLQRGLNALRAGNFEHAVRFFKAVLRQAPRHFGALNLLGITFMQDRNFPEAETYLKLALEQNPMSEATLYNSGIALKALHRPAEALDRFSRALAINPAAAETWNNRGTVFNDLKRYEEAVADFDKAIALNPSFAEALCNKGKSLCILKQFDGALTAFETALALKPDLAEAWQGQGNLFCELKRYEEALASYHKAVAANPVLAAGWLGRANACYELGQNDEALAYYEKAIAIKPELAEAWLGYGNALFRLGRYDEALTAYEKTVSVDPTCALAHSNRGNVLLSLKRNAEALDSCDRAIAIDPSLAVAHSNRGAALSNLKQCFEALASCNRAISLNPSLATAHSNRGSALVGLERYSEALASYDQALALEPALAEAWLGRGKTLALIKRYVDALAAFEKAVLTYQQVVGGGPAMADALLARGEVLFELNQIERASADFRKAIGLNKELAEARFADCFVELPILYSDENEIIERRQAYSKKLAILHKQIEESWVKGDLVRAVVFRTPFYLAYQGMNDYDLQKLYGSIVNHVIGSRYPAACTTQKASADEKIRIGFVTSFFYAHSVWKIIKGWVGKLDRSRFIVCGYHVGQTRDQETESARLLCDQFVDDRLALDGWRQKILADAPHVLVYPGLFMDQITVALAAQRLAPVQCSTWGHPETSGLPSVDFFISSELMEPPDGQAHYTEKLVLMPNLSIHYTPLETEVSLASRSQMGLRSDAVVFWCGQSLFKFLPQYDRVFTEIAHAVKNCQFVFIKYSGAEEISSQFRHRIYKAFEAAGLTGAEHFVYLPELTRSQFIASIGQCDIVLDTIGWSGGISTLESLEHNLPIVTMRGPLMRGRHSAAILTMIDCSDTITDNIEDYVAMAIKLAKDSGYREQIGRRISLNKHRVRGDSRCIDRLECFLESVARR
jgi:protein O-GlcNAc transferase